MGELVDGSPEPYPHLSVLSANPLNTGISNGMLMASLVRGWPQDRLSQVFFPIGNSSLPSPDLCVRYSRIAISGAVSRAPRRVHGRSPTSPPAAFPETGTARSIARIRRFAAADWLRFVQELWYSSRRMRELVTAEVRAWSPRALYTVVGRYSSTILARHVSQSLGIPLCLHVTDDFVTSLYGTAPFGQRWQTASERAFRELTEMADVRIAISPMMAREYSARYGGSWHWFTTAVDPSSYDPRPREDDGHVRFVYAGNLAGGRASTLLLLAESLRVVKATTGIPVTLDIYADPAAIEHHFPSTVRRRDCHDVVKACGWCPLPELPKVFHAADVLVYVESFEEQMAARCKLSFSTKLSQYSMAGRCILAVCPGNAAVTDVLKHAGSGVAVDSSDSARLANAVRTIVVDRELRRANGCNGRTWALHHAARHTCHDRFRRLITAAVDRSDATRAMRR